MNTEINTTDKLNVRIIRAGEVYREIRVISGKSEILIATTHKILQTGKENKVLGFEVRTTEDFGAPMPIGTFANHAKAIARLTASCRSRKTFAKVAKMEATRLAEIASKKVEATVELEADETNVVNFPAPVVETETQEPDLIAWVA